MGKYFIEINGEFEKMLNDEAKSHGMTAEQFIGAIINRYLPLMHKINQEEMAKGYLDMSEINLDIAK